MATKKELIEIATAANIRFSPNWKKDAIEEAIASGVTNDDPIWVDCQLCGVRFDCLELGVSDRTTTHPELRSWRSAALKKGWYSLFKVCLESCKERKIETIEEVIEFLRKAQNGECWEEDVTPDDPDTEEILYNLTLSDTRNNKRSAWVARLIGLHSQYGFDREFLPTVYREGRDRYFNLIQPGFYEFKTWTAKGNYTIGYYQVTESGQLLKVSYQAILENVGNPEALKKQKEGLEILYSFNCSTPVANVTQDKQGSYFYIVESGSFVEDIDGFVWDSDLDRGSEEEVICQFTGYYCRPATESEIQKYYLANR